MAFPNTTFVSRVTVIARQWLQAVNDFINAFPDPTGEDNKFVRSNGTAFVLETVDTNGGFDVIGIPANFPGLDPTGATDSRAALQAFLDACRGKKGALLAGRYRCDGKLSIDPLYAYQIFGSGYNSDSTSVGTCIEFTSGLENGLEIIYSYAQWGPGGGADAHSQFDRTNGNPVFGNSDNLVHIKGIRFQGPGVAAATTTQSIQLYAAGPVSSPTGNGIFCYWANNLILEDCWVSNWPANGITGSWCFGTKIEGGYQVANRGAGIAFLDTNNLLTLNNVRCLGNGTRSGTFINFNCLIGSTNSAYANLGVEIGEVCDFEGAGIYNTEAGYIFSQAAGTLTSLTVSGGVATAVFSTTPSFQAGHYIGVTGGTTAAGTAAINTKEPAIISTVVGNTITFPTSAGNGTYTSGAIIAPYGVGLGLQTCYGAKVNAYTESTSGASVWVYNDCRGVSVVGGHLSGNVIYVQSWYSAASPAIAAAGTGYSVNDVLTVSGGTLAFGGSATQLRVTSVGGGGTVTGLEIANSGASVGRYSQPPSGTLSVTGGSGSGCTCTLMFSAVTPGGVSLRNIQFYGVGGGIYSHSEVGIELFGNQYVQVSAEIPQLYLGYLMAQYAPTLRETNGLITQGVGLSRGINQFVSATAPADVTNLFAGVGNGLLLQDSGAGTARQNVAFGGQAAVALTSGYSNTQLGWRAGAGLTTGFQNVVVGNRALEDATNAQDFVAVGHLACDAIISGGNTIAVGTAAGAAGSAVASGGDNSFLGGGAGRQSTAQVITQTTIVGSGSSMTLSGALTNFLALGHNAQNDTFRDNNRTVIGNSSTTQTKIYGTVLIPTVPTTVASLPAASATYQGARAFVTDATSAAFGAALSGGGSTKVPVFCDGTAWLVG